MGIYIGGPLDGKSVAGFALDGRSRVEADLRISSEEFQRVRYTRSDWVVRNKRFGDESVGVFFVLSGLSDEEVTLRATEYLKSKGYEA
jgi:hypothetical protein